MTIGIRSLAFAAMGLAATGLFVTFAATPSQAATWGNAKWCAVTDNGGGNLMWECVYDTAEECQPFIITGNRGFCSINPYWGKEPG
ncbi:MAG: DUF3551 domain-containing protein [Xanthobacteraceae bacterium]|jgi:hypothetical protein